MKLRQYQRTSLDALYAYWRKEGSGNGLIVLPTGSGKSLILAAICQEILAQYPTMRIAIVTHVRELLAQNYKELITLWPQAPAGLFSAGMGRRDRHNQILICGIQSVWNKTDSLGSFDLMLIDEVHLVSKNTNTMYGKFIAAIKEKTSDARIVGLSATPFRLDSGRLDRGKGKLFDKIVYEANLRDLIKQRFLCEPISKAIATILDVSKVGKRGGEFIPGELEIAVDRDWITKSAASEIVQFGRERKSWLAFCSGVAHAKHMRDAIDEHNIRCEVVTGETPKAQRDHHIAEFKAGRIRCLTSVGVLGIGFNHPGADLIALLRPTASAGLFLQQVGRGLRNAPGKENCLVLDFAGNTQRHGPIDTITASSTSKSGEPGDALAKTCPQCQSIVALACHICPDCGYVFPQDEMPKHDATADSTTSILSQGKPQWVDVDSVKYYIHDKLNSKPSLRAEYYCGLLVYKFYGCFEHIAMARYRAELWWRQAAGTNVPRTTAEAWERSLELTKPERIQVRPDGKYFAIVGFQWPQKEEKCQA